MPWWRSENKINFDVENAESQPLVKLLSGFWPILPWRYLLEAFYPKVERQRVSYRTKILSGLFQRNANKRLTNFLQQVLYNLAPDLDSAGGRAAIRWRNGSERLKPRSSIYKKLDNLYHKIVGNLANSAFRAVDRSFKEQESNRKRRQLEHRHILLSQTNTVNLYEFHHNQLWTASNLAVSSTRGRKIRRSEEGGGLKVDSLRVEFDLIP